MSTHHRARLRHRPHSFALVALLGVAACGNDESKLEVSTTTDPVIVNGGFETGDLGSWTKSTYSNPTGLLVVPPTTVADLQLTAGGKDFTFARTATPPESQLPPGLVAGTGVPMWPRLGTTSAVINEYGTAIPSGDTYHQGANKNVNTIKQSYTTTASDIDPADGKVHVRFVLAPQLEAAGHVPVQQPYFFVVVRNLTAPRAGDIYTNFNFSNQPGVPWQTQGTGASALLFTDWQIFDIAPDADKFQLGDTLEVEVYAAACQPGGHSGTVYVDGFGAKLPSLTIAKTAPASTNVDTNLTYTFLVENNTSGIAPTVTADEVLPRNTTFVSLNAPGGTCTTPPVGSIGTVTCSYGWMNPGASSTFQVTVRNNAPATAQHSGTATAATAARIDDTTKAWTANAFGGWTVYITGGTGAGQQRTITTNTATRLNITPNWATTPNTTSTYLIINDPGTNETASANATSATTSTLTNSAATWTTNQWAGWTVSILSGTGAGQRRTISSNTATQLTVSSNWTTTPNATSVYVINMTGTSGLGKGTATAGTNNTLTDSAAVWADNQWLGWTVTILSGTGAGQQRQIVSNTATALTVSANWTTNPNNTSVYSINIPVDRITNGNYGVKGPTVSRLLGPKRETTITAGVIYTDLAITKTDGVAVVAGNGATTYTITVVNNGPSAVNNAVVTDTFPAALATHSWTCTASAGGTCDTASGTGDINHTVDLAVGASATFTVASTLGVASGTVTNVAKVAPPTGVTEMFPSNNSAADLDDVGTLRLLTVNKDTTDNGTGTVTSVPAAIACGAACTTASGSFLDNSTVTLYAVADPYSVFVGWSGACSGSAPTCTVTMSMAQTVTARFSACGNGTLQTGEGCDDGNRTSGDGCDATCLVENTRPCNATAPGLIGDTSCASGTCDGTGGAPGVCEAAGCGDGHLQAGEGCDDGNTTNGDGCNSSCKIENTRLCNATAPGLTGDASCASGVCDGTGGAPGVCEPVGCGDGHLQAGEGCDDGNTTNGDGCNSACLVENTRPCNATAPGLTGDASCASGVCDGTGGAPGVCEPVGCGDGHLQAGEGCDDGNTVNGDGCNATCKIENTGACNQTAPGLTGDASCASGICDGTGGAPGVCGAVGCGDGHLQAGEGCDDGNAVGGDGCNSACKIENTRACNATAPGLTGDASCASGICDGTGGAPGVCKPIGCGDGHLQATEGCDDGNTANGDGCNVDVPRRERDGMQRHGTRPHR